MTFKRVIPDGVQSDYENRHKRAKSSDPPFLSYEGVISHLLSRMAPVLSEKQSQDRQHRAEMLIEAFGRRVLPDYEWKWQNEHSKMDFVAEVFRAALGLFTTEQLQNIPTYLDCDALFYGVADAQLVMTAEGLLNALSDYNVCTFDATVTRCRQHYLSQARAQMRAEAMDVC